MKLKFPRHMQGQWIRTCQECGETQPCPAPNPNKELTIAFENRKCRRCKSEGLDYGQLNVEDIEDNE